MSNAVTITTPVGRLVQGNVHELNENKDNKGAVKIGKDGKPQKSCFFSVAIPKTMPQWTQEPWGATIHQVAVGAFPGGQHTWPSFAWKVVDGDSQVPNKKGKRPADYEGFKGHWVLKFSGGFLPTLTDAKGTQVLPAEQKIELGDYVQVFAEIVSNNSTESPGVYLNHRMVAFSGYGQRIAYEQDLSKAGFGQAPLPAGVQSVPVAGMAVGGATPPAMAAPAPVPAVPAATQPVAPNPAILQAPSVALPPAPPAPPARKMTAAATATYEAYIAQGWTDAQLIQHGYMVA